MSGYKEFEGRTLDEAIKAACSFYDTSREKLEVEICSDAKGGIFGLVGAKKARIRAKLVQLASVLEDLETPLASNGNGKRQKKRSSEKPSGDEGRNREEKPRQPKREEPAEQRPSRREETAEPRQPRERGDSQKKQAVNEYNGNIGVGAESVAEMFARVSAKTEPASANSSKEPAEASPAKGGRGRERGRRGRAEKENSSHKQADVFTENGDANGDIDNDGDDLSRIPFDQLDQAELESAAREIVSRLTEPFLGETNIAVTIGNDRVRVCITDVEDPGLLIGRDGQNLASLQYLVTRMLSNRMKALLRVQIDAGDYRERQDERLRELALSLAEKVKAGGRPQVTRPLSSYHRRVIHLALQDDPLIQTHSKGEGELKRVMVAKKRQ